MWKDFDINFTLFGSDIRAIENEESVVQSLSNCFGIMKRKNLLNLDFGLDAELNLNGPASSSSYYLLETDIRAIIENYEPRITILNIAFSYVSSTKKLSVIMQYSIKNIGSQVFEFKFNFDVKK